MSPSALIPAPDTIPVAWGWFQVLLTVTWIVHVLFMNAMLGGAIVALLGAARGASGPGAVVSRSTADKLPILVAFAVNAGVAPLLFVQVLYGQFVYTSSVVIASWWLLVIPILILAYYATYLLARRYDGLGTGRLWVAGLAAGLLLVISFLFVNNMSLALTPERWTAWFDRPDGWVLNLGEPTLWPRWLHMVVGAVAVGGLFVALVQDNRLRRGDATARQPRDWALRFFTHGTLLQMLLGIWWLMALRTPVMKLFMGGSPLASALMLLGITAGVVAVIMGFHRKVRWAAALTVVTLILMALMREVVRFGYLAPHYHPRELAVESQPGPMILFLAVFVVGIACVTYMLRLGARAGKEG